MILTARCDSLAGDWPSGREQTVPKEEKRHPCGTLQCKPESSFLSTTISYRSSTAGSAASSEEETRYGLVEERCVSHQRSSQSR